MILNKRKIVLVGTGMVGMSYAYALLNQNACDELVLIDVDRQRAIGEAMAVIMVAGNVANMPGLFQSVRFLTTAVSSEMAYASGLQRQALFSIALVLFLFIMLINIVLNTLLKRKKG